MNGDDDDGYFGGGWDQRNGKAKARSKGVPMRLAHKSFNAKQMQKAKERATDKYNRQMERAQNERMQMIQAMEEEKWAPVDKADERKLNKKKQAAIDKEQAKNNRAEIEQLRNQEQEMIEASQAGKKAKYRS